MLDKHISPDDYPECPECGYELIVEGNRWGGSRTCSECDYSDGWDSLPN